MNVPDVSVLIIVHNREQVIGAAVRSVLAQTHASLECVVVDDGSTDGTVAVVEAIRDPRVRLLPQSHNRGIPLARNIALDAARGEYIAWLDSDDLCHPKRLEVQLRFLDRHPDVGMVGSAARKIDDRNRLMAAGRVSMRSHEGIRALLMFRSAFQQSSILGRAEAMRSVRYNPDFPVCEDVDMFVRFTDRYRVANQPRFLIARRIHPGQTIRSNVDRIIDRQMTISARLLNRLELDYDQDELRRHVIIGGTFGAQLTCDLVDWAEGWFDRIQTANRARSLYEPLALRACFDLLIMKAAMRRFGKEPTGIARLAGRAWRHPAGTVDLVADAVLPLLPFKGRPSAAGLRRLLKS